MLTEPLRGFSRRQFALFLVLLLAGLALTSVGCRTPAGQQPTAEDRTPSRLVLSPGDILEITFPGATNFTGLRKIGPEGAITMPAIGQVQTTGMTASELEDALKQAYETELQDNDVAVRITDSANVVYVTGSVQRPGRIVLTRPLTAFEAILEVGGFGPSANRKNILVVRYVNGRNTLYRLDLEPIYSGGPVPPFYLKPHDVVHVERKTQWF